MTTKICPNCDSTCLALFSSIHRKLCLDCYTWIPWELDKGQKPLIDNNRSK